MEEMKNNSSWNAKKTQTVVGLGLLTAVIVVLQLMAIGIRFGPFNIALTLAPIIVGAALFGWKAGAWLGFVFSFVVLFTPDVAGFMAVSIPGTIITVILKGTAAGLVGGIVYKLIEKKNRYAAVIAAGIATPLVNTGVFLLGCFVFFFDTCKEWAALFGYSDAISYMFFGMVGLNFLIELGINLVLSSVIVFIINLVEKMIKKR